jgi:hypothetical protein
MILLLGVSRLASFVAGPSFVRTSEGVESERSGEIVCSVTSLSGERIGQERDERRGGGRVRSTRRPGRGPVSVLGPRTRVGGPGAGSYGEALGLGFVFRRATPAEVGFAWECSSGAGRLVPMVRVGFVLGNEDGRRSDVGFVLAKSPGRRWVRLGAAGLKAIDFRKSWLQKGLSKRFAVPDGESRATRPGMRPGAGVADVDQVRVVGVLFRRRSGSGA